MEPFLALLPARARVIVTALPTYLAAAVTILTVFAEELISLLPDAPAAKIGAFILAAIVWLTGVINVIRRLTPASPATFGLLPPEQYARADTAEQQVRSDSGHAALETIIYVILAIILIFVLLSVVGRV